MWEHHGLAWFVELLVVYAPGTSTVPWLVEKPLGVLLAFSGLSLGVSGFLDTVHRISLEILFPEQSSLNCRSLCIGEDFFPLD